jgi:PAS domain S-box-containing protein
MADHPLNRDFPDGSDEELSLLYQLGIALASGKDLFSTLLTLQTAILKLIQADAMFIAIYDATNDLIEFPMYFEVGKPDRQPSRRLSERPGLTGAVIYKGEILYLPDMETSEIVHGYAPVDDSHNQILHTFLGIPLIVNHRIIGVLSVQSTLIDAYSADQIQLMENVAIQAALAIDKSRLLDQLKKELDERTKVETDLRQRESILEAVTFAAEQFLKTSDWRLNIDRVLERLGITMHVTHAYLFEDHINSQGEPVTSMRYEWTTLGYTSHLDRPEFQDSKINTHGYEDQVEALKRGDVRAGTSSSFNSIEKEAMDELGIKAILEVPIFVNNKEWGAIGFDDFEQERQWTGAEVDALKIAAGVLSAAIQRERADSAVHESERIYRQAIEAAGAVPYYHHHELDQYVFIGEGIREITGYSSGEITPLLWRRLIVDSELFGELAGLTQHDAIHLVREGKVKAWRCDFQIRAQDGQLRWIADRAVVLFSENGMSYGSVGILQDITERKIVEANLRKGEAILEVVAEAANTFLKISEWSTEVWQAEVNKLLERLGTTINASHAYLFENDFRNDQVRMTMRYEWTAAGFESDLGNPIYIGRTLDTDNLESWNDLVLNGLPYIGDSKHLDAQDLTDLCDRNIQALLDVPIFIDDRWWGTIGFDDMAQPRTWSTTEIDALVVAANLLAAAIKRNQMDSTLQRELEQRKALIEELESKNEELERFTYTVSHDLKSPLVTISGFLGYIEQDAMDGNVERFQQDTQRIQEAVLKMQRLLNELLELSRIGRMMNDPQVLPFNDLAEEAIAIVRGRLEAGNITVQIQPNMSAVYGDKPRLIEVLQNLIDNAAKYMGNQSSPHIEIGQRGEERDKPVFYVRDNGIGIAPEHHERVFGLFNKLDVKTEGTGVGLALVKRIIEVHGGHIWVESGLGQGSTFFFTLPAQPRPDSVI